MVTQWLSASLRIENLWRSNFDGFDPQTPDPVISTNVEQFRGGYWLNIGIGTQATLAGHYFNFELVPNATQDLDGIQLATDFSVIASWSKAW